MSDEKPGPQARRPDPGAAGARSPVAHPPRVGATRRAAMHRRSSMSKPLTIKLTGTFEMKPTVSLKELYETIGEVEERLQEKIGKGSLMLKIGRQELRA